MLHSSAAVCLWAAAASSWATTLQLATALSLHLGYACTITRYFMMSALLQNILTAAIALGTYARI